MKVRVASAGTGKTTSLVLRYMQLISEGTPLRRIAGVTFTRAAADELRQRVGAGVRELLETGTFLHVALPADKRPLYEEALRELDGATLSTIHGFMIEALRLVAPHMGLDPDFAVLGEWEAEAIFEEELKSLFFLAQDPSHGLHSATQRLGDDASQLLILLFKQRSLAETFQAEADKNTALLSLFEAVYERYRIRLGAVLVPPAEVERRALVLIRSKVAMARLAQRFRVVLVDEFQDVNPLQGQFFEALEQRNIMVEVVGDPKQSIYGFRHADVNVFRRALAAGEKLPDLKDTRRHSQVMTRFLNHMTTTLAAQNLGFGPEEAPLVEASGSQADVEGRVELHWVVGEAPVGELRKLEAKVLAEQLKALSKTYKPSDMAVLARSNAALAFVEDALREQGLPYVLVQGRGYYERMEVRDLYHALRVGIDASGLSLGAWLRSPFVALELPEVDRILKSEKPINTLASSFPDVHERLENIQAQVRTTPLDALKFLIREPFIGGKRFVDFLESRARENVDALLFTVAQQPPGDIELLLDRLELLSRQTDAGDVPQSGEGIALLTAHRSKGLEWPVVAVFDLGRMNYHHPQPLYIDPETSSLCLRDTSDFDAVRSKIKVKEDLESYRLLYVAASRARDVLVMTGSIKNGKADGWAKALRLMDLGEERRFDRPEFLLKAWDYQPVELQANQGVEKKKLKPSAWIDRYFPKHPFPPVYSPSGLKQEDDFEPLPLPDPSEGEVLPGKARTLGTLVHYAISQNWNADNPEHIENLKAQEVMFPFLEYEQLEILDEVKMLLKSYEDMLGHELPVLDSRSEDYPELPMALPQGSTVWQGIIDRLYCADGKWYLEDYKTDQDIVPEKYHFQLAVYLKAIREVRGITPQVQLVFLRFSELVIIEASVLEEAFGQALVVET